jgi:hypothetical protein
VPIENFQGEELKMNDEARKLTHGGLESSRAAGCGGARSKFSAPGRGVTRVQRMFMSRKLIRATSGLLSGKFWAAAAKGQVMFSCKKFCKIFQHSPSHRIFRRMHEALNIDKNKTNYTI